MKLNAKTPASPSLFCAPNATAPIGSKPACLTLVAVTAADLMTANPVSIRSHASVHDALALLTDNPFSAVPVINPKGHPVGVLSRTDLVRYERERTEYLNKNPQQEQIDELTLPSGERLDSGFQVEAVPTVAVEQVMTPRVLFVRPETPVKAVLQLLLDKQVHRLFVVDREGVLVGVISTMDILRKLQ